MDFPCLVESGIQVLARLIQTPSLKSLHPQFFSDGPKPAHVIEMTYDSNTPQTILLCELISYAILPLCYNGKNASVAILITDGHFNITILIKVLKFIIKKNNSLIKNDEFTDIIEKCLDRLHIMNVYDSQQLFITIQSLENFLANDLNVSLIVVDTMSAFYWSDRMSSSSIYRMDMYIQKVLRLIQTVSKEYKSVILYLKPSYFVSKTGNVSEFEQCVEEFEFEKLNYRLNLKRYSDNKDGNFQVTVTDSKKTIIKCFNLENDQIIWL